MSATEEPPVIELTRWTGPWPEDDPDANFKADVALYANADPLRTLRGLSGATGIPIGALVRYVLARWASEGASGLLELGPTMTRRLNDVCVTAVAGGSVEARLAAFDQLRQMISWLNHPLDHPEVYDEPIDRVHAARSLESVDEARDYYDRWAVNYDDDIYGSLGVVGTDRLVERIAELIEPTARILDVGCGTGAVGERLAPRGFDNIDGLDLSSKMLRIASHKNVYRHLFEADLTEPLDIDDAAYDAVVSAGTFVSGHVPASALHELVRVIQPGGSLVFTVMDAFWKPGGFEATLADLEAAGAISMAANDLVPATVDGSSMIRIILLNSATSGGVGR
jgi:SAM-dependent methyltransferase